MIEYDISDEDALWDISERIGRERLEPDSLDPAEIEESARRIAAVIAEYPLRFRDVVEAVKCSANAFHARLNGIIPEDRGLGLSDEEANSAAERLFDAIMAAGVSLGEGLIDVALVVLTAAPTLYDRDRLNCLLIADQFSAPQSSLYSRMAGAAAPIQLDIITGLVGRS